MKEWHLSFNIAHFEMQLRTLQEGKCTFGKFDNVSI